jgi:oligosaccharide repeat unit polymerase
MLSMVNYRRKKDILSFSFILSSVWTVYIFLYSITKDIFYDISFETYGIYFIGAFMFSIGEIFGEIFNSKKFSTKNKKGQNMERTLGINKKENFIMVAALLILLGSLPFYYKKIVNLSGASLLNIDIFFWQVRRAFLNSSGGKFSIINNLVPLSLILSVYFYNIYKKKKQKKILVYSIIGVAIIYQLLTGGRAGAVYMILSLIGVEIIRERKIKLKNFIILGGSLLFVLTFIAYFVGKGDVDKTQSFLQNIDAFYKDIIVYLLGGMVAFNNAVIYEGSIVSNGGVARFFLETARSLGFNVHVPSLHMQYTNIGPGIITNVYTIYSYYYIDYGLIGTCFFMFLLGIISYIIYEKAKNGNDFFCVLYGYFLAGLVLSVYSEYFYRSLNFIIKTTIVVLGLEFIKKVKFLKLYKSKKKVFESVESSRIYWGN